MTAHHPSLRRGPANLINGQWRPLSAGAIRSVNPARPDTTVWHGSSDSAHLEEAISVARAALPAWSSLPAPKRFAVLRRFQEICRTRENDLTDLICDETGKVLWDSAAEAGLLAPKVDITLDDSAFGAFRRITPFEVPVTPTRTGRAWFRPHGVMGVLGPYNFPAHLPNGHIVPALAAGNTIVFKPSDKTPAVGQLLAELFQEALDAESAPRGVFNLVHGAADIASSLTRHLGIDGILFTGSWPVGRRILEANLDRPSRICALEMGGNNPAVILPDADLKQAVIECIRSAFITTGQRCTCTRRIIIHEAAASKFVPAFCKAATNLIVGDPRATHPVFMGPIINEGSRQAVLAFQTSLARAGAEVLVPSGPIDSPSGGFYLSPSVVRVDRFSPIEDAEAGCDVEVFGPIVRLCTVRNLDAAIEQANATRFGLAASVFTRDKTAAERFANECRSGCINFNCGTAGASSKLPFGGLGLSGNHRPAGSFSVDYCAYPVAGLAESGPAATVMPGMRIEDSWLA